MIETILEKEYATIEYDTESNIAYLILKNTLDAEQYKDAFNSILEFGIDKRIQKLLIDQSKVEKSGMESRAWLLINWFPRVKKELGEDIKVGLILTKSVFSKIGAEYVVSVIRNISKYDIRIFPSKEEAEKWLLSIHNKTEENN